MIERFNQITGYRIFRSFEWPTGLHEFGRYNLIYGWNASGKTSLSNVFRALQQRTDLPQGEAEVTIDGRRVRSSEFATADLPAIRVFNRDFVDRNVFESPDQHLPPVYFFGEDSAVTQQRITALKSDADKMHTAILELEGRRKRARTDLDAHCTDRARSIRTLLAGDPLYLNYEAPRYRATALRLAGASHPTVPLPEPQRQLLAAKAMAVAMPKIPPVQPALGDLTTLTKRVQAVLDQRLVTGRIEKLVASPDLAHWVQSGLALHPQHDTHPTCQFCDQPMPPDRLGQLEAHFNDRFKMLQAEIALLIEEVESVKRAASTDALPAEAVFYPHLRKAYVAYRETYSSQSLLLRTFLDTLRRALVQKREQPFSQPALAALALDWSERTPSTFEVVLAAIATGLSAWGAMLGATSLARLASTIDEHNLHTVHFAKEVERARADLEQDEVASSLAEWNRLGEVVARLDAELAETRNHANVVRAEIDELEPTVRQHRTPADQLTREMTAYLGREELSFEVRDSGYAILRAGEPAMHLSDGERSAIAFMYFLKSLRDTGFAFENGVVVIDDPVSSLDANSLYSAFGYMRERTRGAGQLFIRCCSVNCCCRGMPTAPSTSLGPAGL